MNTIQSRILSATIATGFILFASSCGNSESDAENNEFDCDPQWEFDTIESGYLSVAAVNNPPSIYVDPDTGEAEGFDADILPEFAERNCLEIRWIPLAGAAAVAAMTEGRADLGSGGWAITEERGEVIGQFEEPVYYNSGAILASEEYTSIEDLEDLTVGVEGGSIYQDAARDALGSDNVRVYQSVEAQIGDLHAGRLDAVLAQSLQMNYQAEQRGLLDEYQVTTLPPDDEYPDITGFTTSNYPFTKNNTELGEAIQEYIAEIKESGEFEEILLSYGLGEENIYGPNAPEDSE